MPRIIAVANQKGGCGKTTTSINLAEGLAKQGRRTLLVDMDPQSHLSLGVQVNPMSLDTTIYDVLIRPEFPVAEAVSKVRDNIDLLPSSLDLASAEIDMSAVLNKENRLRRALEKVHDNYDYIIIDCPPALGILTINALCASNEALVVIETSYFALHGVNRLIKVVKAISGEYNRSITYWALATMHDKRNNLDNDVLEEIKNQFGDNMLNTIVHRNVKLKEAASAGQFIGEYDKSSRGYKDYRLLADELISKEPLFAPPQNIQTEQREVTEAVVSVAANVSVSSNEQKTT